MGDATDRFDERLEAHEVDVDDVVDRNAVLARDGGGEHIGPTVVRGVDPLLTSGVRVGHPQVAVEAEHCGAVAVLFLAQDDDRVASAPGHVTDRVGIGSIRIDALTAVGPDEQVVDGRTVDGREFGDIEVLDLGDLTGGPFECRDRADRPGCGDDDREQHAERR